MSGRLAAGGVALVVALVCAGGALSTLAAQREALIPVLGERFWALAAGLVLGCGAGCALLARVWIGAPARREAYRAALERVLRPHGLFTLLVLGWAAFVALVHPFQTLWFELWLGCVFAFWLVALAATTCGVWARARAARTALRALFALAVAVLSLELGLRAWAAVAPQALFARASDLPRSTIERFRLKPRSARFGFLSNARGFYDEEFRLCAKSERCVAAIGDSFLLGSVPHALNLTTVCERALGAKVHNIGVAGAGPPEYLRLLVDEALPLEPDLVVVGLFVGNDLTCADPEAGRKRGWIQAWFARENVLSWIVPPRLARRYAEKRRQQDAQRGLGQVAGEALRQMDVQALHAQMPWLDDALLEPESMSSELFMELEMRRAAEICRGVPSVLDLVERELGRMRDLLGATPLLVVLWPDEFQVEDGLWEQIATRSKSPLERDLAQRLVRERCERLGLSVLDLLPILRAVPPLADGKRHLYHLRDTHFNARGNACAGEALARFIGQTGG